MKRFWLRFEPVTFQTQRGWAMFYAKKRELLTWQDDSEWWSPSVVAGRMILQYAGCKIDGW